MHNTLNITVERYPIAGKFTISRGSKTEAAVVVCAISNGSRQGRGECVPYARYGESIESVSAQIEAVRSAIENGATRQDIQNLMPAGAARNAVDCALWDLEAKQSGKSVADMLGMPPPPPRNGNHRFARHAFRNGGISGKSRPLSSYQGENGR